MSKIVSVLLLTVLSLCTWAQKPNVNAKLYPDSISIGDRFTVEVTVEKDLTQVIEFPQFKEGKVNEVVEYISETPVDTISRDGRKLRISKKYTMTSFDEGIYSLGKLGVMYIDKNIVDTLYTTDSLNLLVTTFAVDTTTQQIYDIKEPIHTPVKVGEFSTYVILGIIAVQIIIAILYIIVQTARRKKGKVKTRIKTEPAHVTAIRELEALYQLKLWQNNRHKLYYTRLTDILREYIEERYAINAMEMTSEEIIEELSNITIAERSKIQIKRLLSTADYVKFAKYIPSLEDNEMSYNDAYYFVEETKLEEIKEEVKR